MTINNNNYQELLLLYVDGELQPKEMDAVDDFIANNYRAKEELELLLNTKMAALEDVDIKPLQKDALFKFEKDAINQYNYPAYFVEYVNEALSQEDRLAVEAFANTQASLTSEFELYKLTKVLPNQAIVFANKEVLYKKEEKRPVVYMYFKQFSAAAILIGIMLTTFIVINKKDNNGKVVNTSNNETVLPNSSEIKTPITNRNVDDKSLAKVKDQTNSSNSGIEKLSTGKKISSKKNISNTEVALNNVETNKLQSPSLASQKKLTSVENIVGKNQDIVKPIIEEQSIAKTNTNEVGVIQTIPTVSGIVENPNKTNSVASAKNVTYKTLDIDNENENTVYVGNLKLNKQKVNNLLNKVGKIFGKSKKAQLEDVATSTASL
jgi:hypothetical protein